MSMKAFLMSSLLIWIWYLLRDPPQLIYKLLWYVSSDVSRVFLGRTVHASNPPRRHHVCHWAEKFSKFVPPDTLKMHSLALPVLDFFLKHFPNYLKLVSAIFYQIFISHQMIALQKLWKMFFISSKKLFSLSRYSNFCISVFPSISPWQPLP